jgi:DNA-binding NarL/FixJ family response regulator
MIRVVVADDQDLVRAGLCRILDGEDDIEVVGEVGDGESALATVRRTDPDVVLMDIRMPVLDGLSATRLVRESHPTVQVLVLTTFDLDEYVYEAIRAGAAGFVLKDAPADDIVRAVRVVAADGAMIAPTTARRLLSEFAGRREVRADPRFDSLTDRERDIVAAMALGLNNVEIGQRLHVSEGTVRTHVSRVLAKLGVRDRVQAVVLAYEAGIVRPGQDG